MTKNHWEQAISGFPAFLFESLYRKTWRLTHLFQSAQEWKLYTALSNRPPLARVYEARRGILLRRNILIVRL